MTTWLVGLIAKLCLTLVTLHCSQPGSSVHGTFQTRVLVWVAIAFSAFLPWDVTFTGSEIRTVLPQWDSQWLRLLCLLDAQ